MRHRGSSGDPSCGCGPCTQRRCDQDPRRLVLGYWGDTRCSHLTPRCVQLHPPGLHPFPAKLRGASPRAQAPLQPAHRRDGRATRRPFCLALLDRGAARASLSTAAGPCRPPRAQPSSQAPSAAPPAPTVPLPVGISLVPQGPAPWLRAHHAAALREPARTSWRPPGPRFTDSILCGAPIWVGQRDHPRDSSDADSIHSGCCRVRGSPPGPAQGWEPAARTQGWSSERARVRGSWFDSLHGTGDPPAPSQELQHEGGSRSGSGEGARV